jgi:cyclohexanecarboxylate-CoA ligase
MDTASLLTTAHVEPAAARTHRERGHWRDRTHLDDLRERARDHPDRTVLVDRCGGDRHELSAADLADRVERVADGLRAAGVRPREAVAYQLPNGTDAVALLYACARVGAVAVPMTASLGAAQVEQRLATTGAVLAVGAGGEAVRALADMAPRLPELRVRVALDAPAPLPEGTRAWSDLAPTTASGSLADASSGDEVGADDVALVLFTSGTTGRSKAVLHTANTLYASLVSFLGELVDDDEDGGTPRVLTTSVVTHVIGIMTSALGPVVLDRPAVLTDARGPAEVLDVVAGEHVTHLLVGPTGLDSLLDALARGAAAPGCLRVVALGGAPIAAAVLDKTDRLPVQLRVHWGMTEVPGGGVSTGHDPEGTSWHTMGHAGHGLERALDRAGDGAVGEVRVRGPQVAVGIVDSSDGSVVWTPAQDDGWFATGDLAETDPTGELAFVDRDSDEIKGTSGMLVPTADVEDLIATHPDVDEAVLVAHHPHGSGEEPAAVVAPRDGAEPTLEDIQGHLTEQGTTSWYQPTRLDLVDHLDRDAAGKVDKRSLRARWDS